MLSKQSMKHICKTLQNMDNFASESLLAFIINVTFSILLKAETNTSGMADIWYPA